MDLDHEQLSWCVVCVENCEPIDEVAGAPIVYVDAIFAISPEQQGEDWIFPRFDHMDAMWEAAKRASPSPLARPKRSNRLIRETDRGGVGGFLSTRSRARKPGELDLAVRKPALHAGLCSAVRYWNRRLGAVAWITTLGRIQQVL